MATHSSLHSSRTTSSEKDSFTEDGSIDEEEAFLPPSQARWRLEQSLTRTSQSLFRRFWPTIILHLALLAVNISVVTIYATMGKFGISLAPAIESNPLRDVIGYEARRFELLAIYEHDGDVNPHKPNAFNGPPREELENEWDKLMQHSEVRISEEELGEYAGDDSIIQLTDGSGYYVTVSAFHGLHCVRRLHQYIYAEHYYEGLRDWEIFMLRRHTEHCLDWLRQYVQCHADPTFIPIHWTTNDATPVSKDIGNRQCVAWEPFERWMADHSFDPFEPGLLLHPIFGVPDTTKNDSGPALGAHELGQGGLLHADGHISNGTFE